VVEEWHPTGAGWATSHAVDKPAAHRATARAALGQRCSERLERASVGAVGTWTLSEHTSGTVVVLEHEIPASTSFTMALLDQPWLWRFAKSSLCGAGRDIDPGRTNGEGADERLREQAGRVAGDASGGGASWDAPGPGKGTLAEQLPAAVPAGPELRSSGRQLRHRRGSRSRYTRPPSTASRGARGAC